MASINIRIDDELKVRAYRELEKLGVTPSELMRQALQYAVEEQLAEDVEQEMTAHHVHLNPEPKGWDL